MIVRALGWEARATGPRTFSDLGGLPTDMRNAVLILANACQNPADVGTCVAQGYGDGRFGAADPVSHAQVIAFITRAFALDPAAAWAAQPGAPQPHGGVPAPFDTNIRTFAFYAGAIPAAPGTTAGWDAPASRAWVARALWAALRRVP